MAYKVASDNTLQAIADRLGDITSQLDGTASAYRLVMRRWFIENGVNVTTTAGLTALVDKWYALTRDNWNGYTTFYQPDVSAVSTGTKGGDNADLTCEPSTDTTEGQDDYAGLPLFAVVDCNWILQNDDDGNIEPYITAIEGITDNFKRKDTSVYVGVLTMTAWVWHEWEKSSETYTIGYSATQAVNKENVFPLPQAVRQDGTVREWIVLPKYMAALDDNNAFTCCAGVIPKTFLSHNTVHTYTANNGTDDNGYTMYSGTCACDDMYLKLMMMIKYGSLTLDGILQGCVNNNYQYYALAAEESANRILISTSHSLEVGMSVLLGNYVSTTDRGTIHTISGNLGTVITKIETVTVDDTEYSAVYVDMDMLSGADLNDDGTFDTAANGSATSGTTYISTFHWRTGTTDCVLGNDGSPTSNTSGKYPAKLQGVETMNGAYEIIADSILSLYLGDDNETYYYEPYTCRTRANQATSLTSNYEASGAACEQVMSSAGWTYIKKLSITSDGVMTPIEAGGSSSTYTKDGMYQSAMGSTGTREWFARGHLSHGVSPGGLSALSGVNSLSTSYWNCGARLSASGNRGEFAA